MSEFIGMATKDNMLFCMPCATITEYEGVIITQTAYPDGFTCDNCFNPIADQNYKGDN